MRLYIDGNLVANTNVSYAPNPDQPARIGTGHDSGNTPIFYFPGDIDEVRFWNATRTEKQLRANLFKDLSPTETNLVADYKFDTNSKTLINSSTNVAGLNGTVRNSPNFFPSSIANPINGLHFDGINDHVSVPYNANLNPTDITISTWAKVTGGAGSFRAVVSNKNSSFQGYVLYAANNDRWQFWIGTGSGWRIVTSTSPIILNKWTHLQGVYNSSTNTLELYVDGALEGNSTSGGNSIKTSIELLIGASDNSGNPGFFFPGEIADIKFWNTPKTYADVSSTFQNYDPLTDPNIIAHYSFDQGLSAQSNGFLKKLYDFAGGYNGAINNFALTGSASNFIVGNPSPAGGGVSGADLWLKADAGVSPSTGSLSTWADQTTNHSTTIGGSLRLLPNWQTLTLLLLLTA